MYDNHVNYIEMEDIELLSQMCLLEKLLQSFLTQFWLKVILNVYR